ncbi:MAG: polysaccharide biosynthesis tyrosine autokinase [Gemmatimonadales bacterium]
MIKKYRWWILAGGLAGASAGWLVGRLLPAKYVADATVWIETRDRDNSARSSGPIRPDGFLESRQWPELIKSYFVTDSVVQRDRLYLLPGHNTDGDLFLGFELAERYAVGGFSLAISENGKQYTLYRTSDRGARNRFIARFRKGGVVVEQGNVGDSVGTSIGWRWVPNEAVIKPGQTLEFAVLTPREASASVQDRLIARVNGQQFIRLSFTDANPKRAARTLNSITDQFVRVATQLKKQKLIEQRDILAQQTEYAYQRLKERELELENFKIRTVTLPNLSTPIAGGLQSTTPTVMGDFFTKKKQVDALRTDRQAILDLLARGERGELTVDAFLTVPSVNNAPDLKGALGELQVAETELRAARLRYTDSLLPVINLREKIATLRSQTIPAIARALADQLDRQARDLERRIDTDAKELAEIPTRTTEEQRLTREYEAASATFGRLRQRLEEANLAEASEIPDVRKFDPAVEPRKPAGIPKPLLILAGLVAGLGIVIVFAIGRDRLDPRIQYPEQVSGGSIGLTILGVVPNARRRGGVPERELHAQIVEAFREIRMNIVHSFPPGAPVALTISSPSPQDGKSFVSANLAVSFAEAGFRTLVIDGDTRRGTLHSSFQVERRPGLIDHLLGRASVDEIIRTTSHEGLSLIPCGERRSQSPELLGSAQMRQLYEALRGRFDVVIFDSPPFSAGVDAYLLGAITGSLLTVMRSGQTERELAEAKLRVLDRLPIRPIGAVLNAVTLGSESYRYYGYSYGYATDEEQQKKIEAPAPEEVNS